jgi:hexosaminidase
MATYTLDGSLPLETSTRYVAPFPLGRTAVVRARAFQDGRAGSFPTRESFHRRFASAWSAAPPPSAKYAPIDSLFDGGFGSEFDFHSGWCGWEGSDMVVTIDLPAPTALRGLRVRFLRDQRNWIFLPARVRFEVTAGEGTWSTVHEAGLRAVAEERNEPVGVFEHAVAFAPRQVTRIRITAENVGAVPAWHRGAGGQAWVFADEVVAE